MGPIKITGKKVAKVSTISNDGSPDSVPDIVELGEKVKPVGREKRS